jgi:O-antigen/teichoic acid export membrane protein
MLGMTLPEPKTYARRLVGSSAIVFTAIVISGIIGMLFRMFLTRSLTVEDYGLFTAVFVFVSLFGIFHDLGLNQALIKYIPEFSVNGRFDRIKSSVSFVLIFFSGLSFLITILLFVFSGRIAEGFFRTGAAILPLRILSIWFFSVTFYYVFNAAFQGFQNMRMYSLMQFFDTFSVFLLAVLFIGVLGYGVSGAALAYLLGGIAISCLTFFLFRWQYPRIFAEKASINKPLAKTLFKFAFPVFLAGLGGMISSNIDTLTITAFRSLNDVGFYQAAQPAARMLLYFSTALTVVLFPMISELWARREQKLLGQALHFLVKFSLILIIPVALVLITFPEIVLRLLFGSSYLPGSTALQILATAAIIYTLYAILGSVMSGIGKPIVNTKVIALMACLNLVGDLILVPIFGIEGAAVSTFASYLLGLALLFYYSRKLIGLTVPSSSIVKAVAGGLLALLLIFDLKSIIVLPPWPKAFAVMIPSIVFYGAWILLTRAITKDDLKLLMEAVPMPGWLVKIAGRVVRG